MKTRIKLTPLSLAKPGLKLGAPIRDIHGHILLMDGAELNDSVLASLQRHHICCISVLEEDKRSEEELAIERRQTTERINALFHNVEQTDALATLHHAIIEYRLESLS